MNTKANKRERPQTPFRRLRAKHNLRIVDIQKLANVTWPTAASWDRGETCPKADVILRLIDNLKDIGVTTTLRELVQR